MPSCCMQALRAGNSAPLRLPLPGRGASLLSVKLQTGSLPSVLVRQARETMKELEGRLERSSASSDSEFRPLEVRMKLICAPWRVCW